MKDDAQPHSNRGSQGQLQKHKDMIQSMNEKAAAKNSISKKKGTPESTQIWQS